jgi:nucleoside 2-deoxyribosyltransferase
LLIVLNGRAVDEGAAFELGLAWSLGKLCFGFKDDFRQLVADGDNPMIQGALNTIFGSFDDLAAWATEFTE